MKYTFTNIAKTTAIFATSAVLILMANPANARGPEVSWSVNIGSPYAYSAPAPVIYSPAPVVYARHRPRYVVTAPVIQYETPYPTPYYQDPYYYVEGVRYERRYRHHHGYYRHH